MRQKKFRSCAVRHTYFLDFFIVCILWGLTQFNKDLLCSNVLIHSMYSISTVWMWHIILNW